MIRLTNMRNKTAVLGLLLFLAIPAGLMAADSQDFKEAGMALFRAGKYEKALVYFNNAVQANPNDWQAYKDLGDTYSQLGDNLNAQKAYQQSQSMHPTSPASSPDSLDQEQNNPPESQPIVTPKTEPENTVTEQAEPWHKKPGTISSTETGRGGINRINRAKYWIKGELGYNYSAMGELIDAANAYNGQISANGWSGSASAGNHGVQFGGEIGFNLNPDSGFAIGVRIIRAADYHLDVNYEPGLSIPDFQTATFEPWAVPLTLDYYQFFPDSTGRFFISAGVGYYFGSIQVANDYDFFDSGGPTDTITGELTSGGVGFQVSLGREWAINRNMGISLYGRGHYAKISNFKGTLTNSTGQTGEFGLETATDTGTIDVDNTQFINAAYNEKYTTIDFTGFDVGFALSFYTY